MGYVEILKEFGRSSENAIFIDARPFLEDDSYFVDEMHLTYEGHEVIAKVIFDSLLKSGIID